MPRRTKYQMEPDEEPKLDISSLIDVSFLLLIYFLITSTLQKKEADLGLTLPTQIPNDNPDPIDPVAIKITVDGAIHYDNEEIEGPFDPEKPSKLAILNERLKEYKNLADAAGDKPMVIVAAEDQGKTQRFIDVINKLAENRISSVTMTGFREEE